MFVLLLPIAIILVLRMYDYTVVSISVFHHRENQQQRPSVIHSIQFQKSFQLFHNIDLFTTVPNNRTNSQNKLRLLQMLFPHPVPHSTLFQSGYCRAVEALSTQTS